MTNIVCLKVGQAFSADYVNKLRVQVANNVTLPYRFICLTDDPTDVIADCLPVDPWLPKWWGKLTVFKKDPYGLTGKILFIDLDTIIVDNIDALLTYPSDLCLLKDFTKPDKYGSGIFLLTVGAHTEVWDNFSDSVMEMSHFRLYGDQAWIQAQVKKAETWPTDWCVSYKLHARTEIPQNAKVVCFHGKPRPHEVIGWPERFWQRSVLA